MLQKYHLANKISSTFFSQSHSICKYVAAPTATHRHTPVKHNTRIANGKQLWRVGSLRNPGSRARKTRGSTLVPCFANSRNKLQGEEIGSERTCDWDGGVVGAEHVEFEAAERVPESLVR